MKLDVAAPAPWWRRVFSVARYELGGRVVEFTLYYQDRVKANGDRKHKHRIRQCLHRQIKELWNQPPLNEHRSLIDPSYEPIGIGGNVIVTEYERPSVVRSVGSYNFASVVSSEIHLVADLTITYLRPGPPGALVQGGDIDNRMKTLLDALKIPTNTDLPDKGPPLPDQDPLFCLLEDDSLITGLIVKTDSLPDPDFPPTEVILLIHVRTRPTIGTYVNLGLEPGAYLTKQGAAQHPYSPDFGELPIAPV